MKTRHQFTLLAVTCALIACSDQGDRDQGGAEAPASAAHQAESTRSIMRDILESLQVVLPLAADDDAFRDPANRGRIAAGLTKLSEASAVLEEHTRQDDPQMRFLARSVERDAREAQRKFGAKHYVRSAFLLNQITENCIVCHTRVESETDSALSRELIDPNALDGLDGLDLEARASLFTATRRFDDALATLEELLASPEHPALMLGPLTDYLVLSIRVKKDFERPVPVLQRFAKRTDVWTSLRNDVEGWIEAIPQLHKKARKSPTLPTARSMIATGTEMDPFEGHHAAGLLHYIVASSILEDIISTNFEPSPALGESYYLLGLVESRIGRNYWVTPAPFLLETAIRLAPDAPYARNAYSMLEREILQTYEGSVIQALPSEDRKLLSGLRELIEED